MDGGLQFPHVGAAADGRGPSPAGCGPVGSDQSLASLGAVGCIAVGVIPFTLIPWRLHPRLRKLHELVKRSQVLPES